MRSKIGRSISQSMMGLESLQWITRFTQAGVAALKVTKRQFCICLIIRSLRSESLSKTKIQAVPYTNRRCLCSIDKCAKDI
jgi:hypothetical protein